MTANYMRLRDGTWGLWITSENVHPLLIVNVTKKDGTTRHETVGKILGRGHDGWVCEIASRSDIAQLKSRPNTDAPRITLPSHPLPPDDGTVPF